MSNQQLEDLLDSDLESKYSPMDQIKSFKCLEYELQNSEKVLEIGLIEQSEVQERESYLETLRQDLKNQIDLGRINLKQALNESLKTSENLLKDLMRSEEEIISESGPGMYKFLNTRLLKRLSLIKSELNSLPQEEEKQPSVSSMSYVPSQDSEMTIEEGPESLQPALVRKTSKAQKEFDMNLRRAETEGSVVLEEYDYSDIKKVLKERLLHYEEALNYCRQIGQKRDIIEDLATKADLIKHFVGNYKHSNEDDYLQLIVKLPRDITPFDLFGNNRKSEFLKYIEYIEKVIPQIQKERNRMMAIFKATKDPISKENCQRLIKLVKEQEGIRQDLMTLLGNKWQPLPDIHISELHFPTMSGSKESGQIIQVNINLPKSFSKTFFRYYLTIRLNDYRDETMDKRDIPITGTNLKIDFELGEDESRKKLASYKIEIELFQYRLKIFDSLQEYTTIELKRFRSPKANRIKHTETWDEERYTFEVSLKENEEEVEDSVLKVVQILDIPNPFKLKKKEKEAFQKIKQADVVMEDESKEETKEPVETEVKRATEKAPPVKTNPKTKPQPKPVKESVVVKAASKPAQKIPPEIKQDELQDPDVQRNLFSLYYCTKRYDQIDQKISIYKSKKARIPKDLSNSLLKFQRQKMQLEAAIENEQVTYEQYMGFLQKALDHDKVLVKYLSGEKQKLVEFRIECTLKEINGEIEPPQDSDSEEEEEEE